MASEQLTETDLRYILDLIDRLREDVDEVRYNHMGDE